MAPGYRTSQVVYLSGKAERVSLDANRVQVPPHRVLSHPITSMVSNFPRFRKGEQVVELSDQASRLIERAKRVLTTRHYSRKTTKVYLYWIGKFLSEYPRADPYSLREPEVNRYLSRMAVELNVASSTQNQALSAIKFLFKFVMGEPLDALSLVKARGPRRKIVALNAEEVQAVLSHIEGVPLLVCMLLYGSGLRLEECLGLRVKDIDLRTKEVFVREGKGKKDRVTILPDSVVQPLREHLKVVRRQHFRDLEAGLGRVPMPYALDRKYPNADREWIWQWVFPARSHYVDPRTGVKHRYHLHESVIQKAVRAAALKADVRKHVTPHVLRHSFATQLVNNQCDIRTLQELMGHEDIRTTQGYLHVLSGGNHGVTSPLDGLTLNREADAPGHILETDEGEL